MYSKENPESIKTLFDNISDTYDFLNGLISLGTHNYIKNDAINTLRSEDYNRIIDLCTGTGDIAFLLTKKFPDAHILAVDFSSRMLDMTRKKFKGEHNIMTEKADVMMLPHEDNTFDLCTIFFGLRNIQDTNRALDEIYRVLKPDAELLVVDLVPPENKFADFYINKIMPKMAAGFTRDKEAYQYLADSIKSSPSHSELLQLLRKHKFRVIKRKEYSFGLISLHLAKKFIE